MKIKRKMRLGCAVGLGTFLALATSGQAEEKLPTLQPSVLPATELAEVVAIPAAGNSPAPAAAPASPVPTASCDGCGPFDFSKVPVPDPFPRMGSFLLPSTGPNHYYFIDLLRGDCRDKPPVNPFGTTSLYPPSSFNYDFRYLDKPDNQDHDWSDPLKRIKIHENWMFSTGGELRFRYADESNARLTGIDNDYGLARARLYGDIWYKDQVRFFAEGLFAESSSQAIAKLPIDTTGTDLLNAFVEAKVGDPLGMPAYVRAGRQEILLGSQRLISTLDWANTRRTFDGVRGFARGEQWDFDAFWLKPVIPGLRGFDSADSKREFTGAWATYKPRKGTALDLYLLHLTDTRAASRGDTSTFGSRYAGDVDGAFLFDFEGATQWGQRADVPIRAGMATAGLGYRLKDCGWNPQAWIYYDYASGNAVPGSTSEFGTFNQLFPFGHYYLGFIDDVARQNIQDLNFQACVQPQAWLTLLGQFHHFRLASDRDSLFGAAGVPLRTSSTGAAGSNVGNEVDLIANMALTKHQTVLLGYSILFSGSFIDQTGPISGRRNAQLVYAQYNLRW